MRDQSADCQLDNFTAKSSPARYLKEAQGKSKNREVDVNVGIRIEGRIMYKWEEETEQGMRSKGGQWK
jgi:hypothetical protein